MFMTPRTTACLIAVLLLFPACKGDPNKQDIEKWIRAGNFTKVNDYVSNKENNVTMRVQAIELLVEYGQNDAIQHAIEQVTDRDEFVPLLVDNFLSAMTQADEEIQVQAKEALFALMRYLDEKRQDEVLKKVAEWGFAGLDDKTPAQQLVDVIQKKNLHGQLNQLGDHGIRAACWLIQNGIDTARLSNYVSQTKDPKLQVVVLNSIRKLFAMKNLVIPWVVLEAVIRFPIPETVAFLVDVYMNESFSDDVRSSALAAGQALLEDREETASVSNTPEKRKKVLAALKKLMTSPLGTDRWDAADMILYVGGVEELASMLDGLKNDTTSYVRFSLDDEEIELPDFVIIELCTERMRPKKDIVRPVLEARLASNDRVQQAFAILCLKVLGQPASIEKLQTLLKNQTSLEDFFFLGEERKKRRASIDAKDIPELTVGSLAKNAIAGIKMLAEIEKARSEKKMTPQEADLRVLSAISVISVAGKAFKPAVELAYLKKKKRIDDEPAPEPDAEPKKSEKSEKSEK